MINTKFIDGTRFLLALWVFLGHFYFLIGAYNFIGLPYGTQFIGSPGFAVDGFIIITGFLMTYTYISRKDIEPYNLWSTRLKFWLRRFFRLYPVYLLALLIGVLLISKATYYNIAIMKYFTGSSLQWNLPMTIEHPTLLNIILHLFNIQGLVPGHITDIISPAWSLSLEVQFYLVFPFVFYYFFTKEKQKYFFLFLIACVVGSNMAPNLFGSYLISGKYAHYNQPSILPYKMPLFILGMVLASTALNKLNFSYLLITLLLVLPYQDKITNVFILLFIIVMYLQKLKEMLPSFLYNFVLTIRNILSSKIATVGGNISYSFYLLHLIIMPFITVKCIVLFGAYTSSKHILALISLIASLLVNIVLSYIIYRYIEKPCIILGKKLLSNKKHIEITQNNNSAIA